MELSRTLCVLDETQGLKAEHFRVDGLVHFAERRAHIKPSSVAEGDQWAAAGAPVAPGAGLAGLFFFNGQVVELGGGFPYNG